MKLAVLTAPATFEIRDVPVPTPAPDEVLVQVAACGVCTSELDMWQGLGSENFPLHPGHEVSGTVAEVGEAVRGIAVGDPVAVWATGRGFAEYVAVKAEYCRPAGEVPLDLALAEPLACSVNTVELADVRLADDVVIIGAGYMGNLVQQLVALRGARHVVVADTRPDALERAAALGATRVVDVRSESLADVVAELTDGRGADITFEVTGSQQAIPVLGGVTRMSGKVVIVGYHQGEPRQIPLGDWNWMAFHIVNAHFRDVATIMRGMTIGMRLLLSGQLAMEPLVTHRFSLGDIGTAFATAHEKPAGFAKAVVTMDASVTA